METPEERAQFRRRLLRWFDQNQRDLPWRKDKSRYRIWISEIMLQQTQVATVVGYFERFLKKFPTIKNLAEGNESQVLKLWEGLGYYRRARQIHAAAKIIVDEHNGNFPDTFNEVLSLPGIGRYTASAILSIADDQPHSILEGNTIRVYSRLWDFREDVTSGAGQKQLWAYGDTLITKNRPGDLNQALMELGSEICRARTPSCLLCPVQKHCIARLQGVPENLPNKGSRKIRYENSLQAAVVVQRKGKVALRLCGPDEHWTGLWDFPRFVRDHTHTPARPKTTTRNACGYPKWSKIKPACKFKSPPHTRPLNTP